MKKIIVLLVTATLVAINASAQLRTSYFMEGSYFRNELNPALTPTRGYIAIPALSGVGVNLNSNFLSVDNFLYKHNGEVVTALHSSVDADKFLGRLPQTGFVGVNLNANILGAGFYTKNSFWNFGINLRSSNDITLSKDVFKVLKTLSNGHYDLNNTSLSSTSYLELYVGNTRKVADFSFGTLTAGAKVKILAGLLNASSQIEQMYADISSESVKGELQGTLRANGVIFDPTKGVAGQEITEDVLCYDVNQIFGNLKNFGAAIDLGAELTLLNDHLRLSAAVTDLGFIKWSKSTYIEAETVCNFYYNGINLNSGEADSDASAKLYMADVKKSGYTTRLNCSLNFGAEYNILNNHIGFGVLSHTEFRHKKSLSELTLSVNFRPTDWISATLSHTLLSRNKLGILGFALNVHPKGVNLFVGADYLPMKYVKYENAPIPYNAKSINIYFGLGFNLGKAKES